MLSDSAVVEAKKLVIILQAGSEIHAWFAPVFNQGKWYSREKSRLKEREMTLCCYI